MKWFAKGAGRGLDSGPHVPQYCHGRHQRPETQQGKFPCWRQNEASTSMQKGALISMQPKKCQEALSGGLMPYAERCALSKSSEQVMQQVSGTSEQILQQLLIKIKA